MTIALPTVRDLYVPVGLARSFRHAEDAIALVVVRVALGRRHAQHRRGADLVADEPQFPSAAVVIAVTVRGARGARDNHLRRRSRGLRCVKQHRLSGLLLAVRVLGLLAQPVDLGLELAGLLLELQDEADPGEVEAAGGERDDLLEPLDVAGAVASRPPSCQEIGQVLYKSLKVPAGTSTAKTPSSKGASDDADADRPFPGA